MKKDVADRPVEGEDILQVFRNALKAEALEDRAPRRGQMTGNEPVVNICGACDIDKVEQ